MGVARHPLVRDFLELADNLAQQAGRSGLRQAALRRSVSTSYYAVFHALCAVCSDGLVRWSRTELVDRTYRALDHGTARRKLAAMTGSDPVVKRFSRLFNLLQDSRHDADYERSRVLLSRAEALLLLSDAREAVDFWTRWTKTLGDDWPSNSSSQNPADPDALPASQVFPMSAPPTHAREPHEPAPS